MSYITSFGMLDEEISKIPGNPTVLEALWEEGLDGWFINLSVFVDTGEVIHIGLIGVKHPTPVPEGDIWPQAALAKMIGEKAIEKYGLTFYFPSDKEPDDNCPMWDQRDEAVACAVCGKMIMPVKNPFQPPDLCGSCRTKVEQQEKLKRNDPLRFGVYGTYQKKEDPTIYREDALCSYLQSLHLDQEEEVTATSYSAEKLAFFRDEFHREISRLATEYQPAILNAQMQLHAVFKTIRFDEQDYELEIGFNNEHQLMNDLFNDYQPFERAVQEGWSYQVHVIRGIGHRDDAILKQIAAGVTGVQALQDYYAAFLSAAEVLDTLWKLHRLGCIDVVNETAQLTERGQYIL